MNDFLNKYGQWALIAGSAEGLGEAYSRALARRGMNLVMVDFQEEILLKFSGKLQDEFQISTRCLHLDLALDHAPKVMMEEVSDLDCRLLVYNAAYSRVQPFLKNTEEDLDRYITINTRNLIQMALSFAKKCREHGSGGMLFMSSLAAFWGTQLLGPYGATKAFDYILAEALNQEMKPFSIDVMACIAGATATPAYLSTQPKYGWPRPSVMHPDAVAEKALSELGKKVLFIPGFSNRFNYFLLSRVFPRGLSRKLFNSTTAKMYSDRL